MDAHSVFYSRRKEYAVPATETQVVAPTPERAKLEVARAAHRAGSLPPYRSMLAQTAGKVRLRETTRSELAEDRRE